MDALRITNDYMIYLDNVRIDHIVSNFTTNHSIDTSMPSASISSTITFGRDMSKADYEATYTRYREDLYNLRRTIKHKTNVFIFVKNIVSGKFQCVFNGLLQDVFISTSKSKRTLSMDITCIGSISLLQQLEALLSIPFEDLLLDEFSATAFKLQARTLKVDNDSVEHLQSAAANDVTNMTLRMIRDETKKALKKTNQAYMNPESMQAFNAILDRIGIYSDIKSELLTKGVLDYGLVTDALLVETLYVRFAKQLGRMMLEFFESPSGEVTIKAPYWNTPVLYNHIIPDIAIISENLADRHSQRVTRTIIQGDVSFELYRDNTDFGQHLVMPMAAYTEDSSGSSRCTNLANIDISNIAKDNLWVNEDGSYMFVGDEVGSSFYDSQRLVYEDHEGTYLAYRTDSNANIYYAGPKASVVDIELSSKINNVSYYAGNANHLTLLKIEEGVYEGFHLLYGGIENPEVSKGDVLLSGMKMGKSYKWNKDKNQELYNTSKANIFIKGLYPDYVESINNNRGVARTFINPKIMFRDFYADKKVATFVGFPQMNIGDFGYPTDYELLYGVSVSEEVQPIIKYNELSGYVSATGKTPKEEAIDTLMKYSAYRYKAINAHSRTMGLSLIPMPWLKPGFNMWVDPTGVDEVYYVNRVTHNGSPDGVYTNVDLTMGREAETFFEGSSIDDTLSGESSFGSVSADGTYGSNIFISNEQNNFDDKYEKFGLVKSFTGESGYTGMLGKIKLFKSSGDINYNASDEPLFKTLFGKSSSADVVSEPNPSSVAEINFEDELSESEIQSNLDYLFKNTASNLIKVRAANIGLFVSELEATWSKKGDGSESTS